MRIALDTYTLRIRHAGVALYALQLANALLRLVNEDEQLVAFDGLHFRPINSDWPQSMHAQNERRVNGSQSELLHSGRLLEGALRSGPLRHRLARGLKEVAFVLGERHFDLFHAIATLPPGRTRKPMIPLVHDVSILRFPETHPIERARAYERWVPDIAQAPVVNTVSVFSREEIVNLLGVPRERIVVTLPGVDPFFHLSDEKSEADALRSFELDGCQLILLVGTREPRKNISVALAAFAALPSAARAGAVLMIVGGNGWGNLAVPAAAKPLMDAGRIRFAGYVSRLTLRALYRRAALLVFPTLYEGFGSPAAEALACGTAVAVSSGTSLEEVVGEQGIYVSSGDVEGWCNAMLNAIKEPLASPEIRAIRRARAAHFNWTATAQRTLAMYRSVCNGTPLPEQVDARATSAHSGLYPASVK